jgi:phage/plasmid-like protein (TIGR03299 family)
MIALHPTRRFKMAHQLTERKNGFVEMAYAGATPWHGLGQEMTKGAPLEQWQVQAGMDWTIEESPVQFAYKAPSGAKCMGKVSDKKVLYRSDSFAPLGTVGDGFKVVQPHDVLEFFRDLTEQNGMTIETAGTLFGGRRFWTLAHIGDSCEVVPGDKVGGYLLLCTGADGTLATTGQFTTVRVVCNNTLSMSLAGSGLHKVSHKMKFDPKSMKEQMGLAHDEFRTFKANMQRLSDKTVSTQRAERLAFDLLAPKDFDKMDHGEKVQAITTTSDSRAFRSIMALFEGGGKGADIDGVKGTAWGFVNAVTEYTDYHARATSVDNRLNSAWLGAGNDLKNKAVELALSF